jgi:uncharacterized protein YjdB
LLHRSLCSFNKDRTVEKKLNTLSSYTKLLLAAFSIIAVAQLSGCGGGGGTPAAVTLNSIAITPTSTTTLPKGTSATLTATGTYSDGTSADISTQVNWASASSAIATVGLNTGTVTGVAVGSAAVFASMNGVTSPDARIEVTAATLVSIAITPGSTTTLAKGTTAYLTATGTYSDGPHDITTQVDWTSDYPSIATVGIHDGSVLGAAGGSATVTASLNGITSSNAATINVTAATLISISITPASTTTLAKGTTANLTTTGTYSDGPHDITTQVDWTSDHPSIASVGLHDGSVLGTGVGSATVTASLNGITSSNEATINVTPATWNSADMGTGVYLTDANLTAKSTVTFPACSPYCYRAIRATVGVSSGKAYWEITPVYNSAVFGIMGPSANLESWVGSDAYGWGVYPDDGTLHGIGMDSGWVATRIPYGAVIGFGLDMDAGTLRIWVNGIDRGIAFTGLTGTIYPASTIYAEGVTANFGATPFVTNPLPAGYNADVFQH